MMLFVFVFFMGLISFLRDEITRVVLHWIVWYLEVLCVHVCTEGVGAMEFVGFLIGRNDFLCFYLFIFWHFVCANVCYEQDFSCSFGFCQFFFYEAFF